MNIFNAFVLINVQTASSPSFCVMKSTILLPLNSVY